MGFLDRFRGRDYEEIVKGLPDSDDGHGKAPQGEKPSTSVSNNAGAPQDPSRRKFLKAAGATAAFVATGGVGREIIAAATGGEAHAEYPEKKFEGEPISSFEEFEHELQAFVQKEGMQEILDLPQSKQTLEQQDVLHDAFAQVFPYERLVPALQAAFEDDYIGPFYGRLLEYQAHGYIYKFAREHKDLQSTDFNKILSHARDYYAVRTEDYLPQAKDLRPVDIDPRAWAKDLDDGHAAASIHNVKAWLDPRAQEKFKSCFSDAKVRDALTTSKHAFTLVESFSFVKALLKKEAENPDAPRALLIEALLDKGEQFRNEEIIGDKTDQFLYIYDPDVGKNPRTQQYDTGEYDPNVLSRRIDAIVGKHVSMQSLDIQEGGNFSKYMIAEMIKDAKDDTVIYFNVHGNAKHFKVNDQNSETGSQFTHADLADALFQRIIASNNVDAVKNFTFLVDACDAYLFVEKLRTVMKDRFAKYKEFEDIPFSKIGIPNKILTSAHEGGLALGGRSFYREMTKELPEGQPFNGDWLSRKVQPEWYRKGGDMTVYVEGTGDVIEIGAVRKKIDEIAA
ncbi:MAG: hypothetical protein COU34_04995 [Candidatus Magasanikbacteria bacterium CG10_big_fil_rev_8_21_14_0_10_43_9]|nr:MAG: hypothetical protein COU34_04995 [Candidatus Magasanikbacteria bacterium CG10_big_fil_rev_8_21_14_0_10_43_9]PIY92221.1 MAG: hypothetical protein COY70_04405 [Candidatus Magasanikbacteria bacterium CG_4_10_14_0_8_um_filter_42_12]